jgi:Tfp pilus assembly protein PilN
VLAAVMLLAAAAAAIVLAVLYQRARADAASLASDVERLERMLSEASPAASAVEARLVATRLRLALESGAASSVPPTSLLRLVETALPGEVLLESLSFGSNPPSLTLEASAASGDRVTELQRRLASSPLVSTTSLLEERRLPDGRLSTRLQVGIKQK